MRDTDFEAWLERWYRKADGEPLDPRSRSGMQSNAGRVERVLGDLDDAWARDRGRALLARLQYSREDGARGRPPPSGVRIDGDVYNVLATMRRSAVLYFEFCSAWPKGAPSPAAPAPSAASVPARPTVAAPVPKAAWPLWPEPSTEDLLPLARTLARFARLLHPRVVEAIVAVNEARRAGWASALLDRGVDSDAYLWDLGPCAFPGVRRHTGSRETAEFHGHREADGRPTGALATDDNHYPKVIWSFVFRGKTFQNYGPPGYALAHLADHKDYGNRGSAEIGLADAGPRSIPGLFTSPTNTAYLPTSLLRPTDHAAAVRNLLLRRAQHLYRPVAHLFPPPYVIPDGQSEVWSLDAFDWAEPVGTTEHVARFLDARRQAMEKLLALGAEPA